jgi:cell division transport system ATP-binding protein
LLELNKVTKLFEEGTVALENVSFSMSRGEFLHVAGPNRAGKTTLLKLIAARERPTGGEIVFDQLSSRKMRGKEIALLRRKLGLIFQDLNLIEDASVFDNVALSLRVLGKKTKEIRRQVDQALDMVGLFAQSRTSPARLSSAERQKVAVARAMVKHPLLLLADEPTQTLDERDEDEMLNLLKRINLFGTAVLLTTRNAPPPSGNRVRVIRMEKGKLIGHQIPRPEVGCPGRLR